MSGYQLITWPESQKYMNHPDFEVEAVLITEEIQVEKYGSSAYLIPNYIIDEIDVSSKSGTQVVESKRKLDIANLVDKLHLDGLDGMMSEFVESPQLMLLINNCDTKDYAWKKNQLLVPLAVAIQAVKNDTKPNKINVSH